jgi:prevent-host-death family protein
MRSIPQRELRNNISRVLREVEAGESVTVTVDGRPVAQIVPVESRRVFVPRQQLQRLFHDAPLDRDFTADVDAALDETVDIL